MNLTSEPGWSGFFTRDTYPGAIPNGTRIVKVNSEPNDGNKNGTPGTILGSVGHPEVGTGYFIEWDSTPNTAVFVMAKKITVVENGFDVYAEIMRQAGIEDRSIAKRAAMPYFYGIKNMTNEEVIEAAVADIKLWKETVVIQ